MNTEQISFFSQLDQCFILGCSGSKVGRQARRVEVRGCTTKAAKKAEKRSCWSFIAREMRLSTISMSQLLMLSKRYQQSLSKLEAVARGLPSTSDTAIRMSGALKSAKDVIEEGEKLIAKRQKHIKLAVKSELG